jgi:hypothetical protein
LKLAWDQSHGQIQLQYAFLFDERDGISLENLLSVEYLRVQPNRATMDFTALVLFSRHTEILLKRKTFFLKAFIAHSQMRRIIRQVIWSANNESEGGIDLRAEELTRDL